jgi:ElaB/YqjD/DUF883 family membrane-anchored ribosome-binding protein
MADEPQPEVIRHQMEETRADISQKLETLEGELEQKVHAATDTVSETVADVKETVQETVETVKDTVHETLEAMKSAFDIPHQVDQHPWLMLGGAVAVGYVGGCLLNRLEGPSERAWHDGPAAYSTGFQTNLSNQEQGITEGSSGSRRLSELAQKFKPELDELKGLAVGAALSLARDFITRALPQETRQRVAETVDHFTTKLGGKPIQGLLPPEEPEQQPRREPTMAG